MGKMWKHVQKNAALLFPLLVNPKPWFLASTVRQEIKGIRHGKEEVKFHFTDDLIVYVGNCGRKHRTV